MADAANLSIRVKSTGVRQATSDLNRLEKQGQQTDRSTTRLAASLRTAGVAAGAADPNWPSCFSKVHRHDPAEAEGRRGWPN